MSVVYTKKVALLPLVFRDSLGPLDVENNCDTVLVVVADDALVGVGSVGLGEGGCLLGKPARLVVRQLDALGLFEQAPHPLDPALGEVSRLHGHAEVRDDFYFLAHELGRVGLLVARGGHLPGFWLAEANGALGEGGGEGGPRGGVQLLVLLLPGEGELVGVSGVSALGRVGRLCLPVPKTTH
jgi:hypothetical protein